MHLPFFLTPNNRSVFRAGVSLNIHSFIRIDREIVTLPILNFLSFIARCVYASYSDDDDDDDDDDDEVMFVYTRMCCIFT